MARPRMPRDGGLRCSAPRKSCPDYPLGADYGRLEAEGREQFEGVGVYYAATALEGQLCRNETVVVAGSGNSAGPGSDVPFGRRGKGVTCR